MKSTGLLKTELLNLERNAETLERVVYSALVGLESMPDELADKYEPKVLRKLERLDELQGAIDAVVAELKARGAYEPSTHSAKVYEYKPPNYVRPLPAKQFVAKARADFRKAKGERTVYPVQAPKESKSKKRKTDREIVEAREARKAATAERRKAASEAREAAKAARLLVPRVKPVRKPKTQLQLAEKGVYDTKRDLAKQEAIFEGKRLRIEQSIATAKARIEEYADMRSADGGSQKRFWARDLLTKNEAKLADLPKLKRQRIKELAQRQARYEAEVQRLRQNRSLEAVA